MRRVARESVFQLVFEYTFYQTPNDDTLQLMLLGANLNDDDRQYISETYGGVCADFEQLKGVIADNLEGYSLERLYRPDFVALLLAVYELRQASESDAVIINEAVSLAKKFGSEKSGKFVNGVLARIVKSMRGQDDQGQDA